MEEHNEYSAEEASPEEIEGEGSSLDDETYSRVLAEDILNTEWAMTPDEEYSFQVTGTEDRMEFVLFESGNPENVCYRGYSKIISATETCDLYITFGVEEDGRRLQLFGIVGKLLIIHRLKQSILYLRNMPVITIFQRT